MNYLSEKLASMIGSRNVSRDAYIVKEAYLKSIGSGAIGGAGIGALAELLRQKLINKDEYKNVDWGRVARTAGAGAILLGTRNAMNTVAKKFGHGQA